MKYKNNFLKLLKIGFVLLLVYVIITVCHFFVFSDKLTYDELVAVTDCYEEMRPVNDDIKNDFYVNTLLKVLDKEYILEELRKDSLKYSIYVVNRSFELFSESLNANSTAAYVSRCELNFENFVGLENSSELFYLTLSFFQSGSQQVEDFTTFGEFMDEIVSNEYTYLNKISENRNTNMLWFISSYFVLIIFFYFIDFNKVFYFVKNKLQREVKK